MKKNGFTLIELLAVIVILAIIALIVTPVVSGIITSARNSANARSVEGHIRNIELAIINDAFALGAGDLTIYDTYTTQEQFDNNSLLTIPTNDHVTCRTYSLNNGQVTAATNCVDETEGAHWNNYYNYDFTKGAELGAKYERN